MEEFLMPLLFCLRLFILSPLANCESEKLFPFAHTNSFARFLKQWQHMRIMCVCVSLTLFHFLPFWYLLFAFPKQFIYNSPSGFLIRCQSEKIHTESCFLFFLQFRSFFFFHLFKHKYIFTAIQQFGILVWGKEGPTKIFLSRGNEKILRRRFCYLLLAHLSRFWEIMVFKECSWIIQLALGWLKFYEQAAGFYCF